MARGHPVQAWLAQVGKRIRLNRLEGPVVLVLLGKEVKQVGAVSRAAEVKRREEFVCNCMGKVCGVNRDYGQIRQDFLAGFVGGSGLTHVEALAVDRKWRSLGKQAKAGRL